MLGVAVDIGLLQEPQKQWQRLSVKATVTASVLDSGTNYHAPCPSSLLQQQQKTKDNNNNEDGLTLIFTSTYAPRNL